MKLPTKKELERECLAVNNGCGHYHDRLYAIVSKYVALAERAALERALGVCREAKRGASEGSHGEGAWMANLIEKEIVRLIPAEAPATTGKAEEKKPTTVTAWEGEPHHVWPEITNRQYQIMHKIAAAVCPGKADKIIVDLDGPEKLGLQRALRIIGQRLAALEASSPARVGEPPDCAVWCASCKCWYPSESAHAARRHSKGSTFSARADQ